MAKIRVYLFTYKRNKLLPRAITSLITQTFTDWICEVHNDCPEDVFPQGYLQTLGDDRLIIKNHIDNIGPTASFNLAFNGCQEEYISILEDDNWWEPDFLQEMIAALTNHPEVNVAWSNMHLWREQADGSWENTWQTTWPTNAPDRFFAWDYKQAMGALHSNGAMICRGAVAPEYIIPDNCEFSIIEGLRERAFKYPIMLVSNPLANFSHTLQTSRSADAMKWTGSQILLLSGFIATAKNKQQLFTDTLAYYRRLTPSPIPNFFLANFFLLKDKSLYKLLHAGDWLISARWLLRNAIKLRTLSRYLKSKQNIYEFLLMHPLSTTTKSPVPEHADV